MFWWCQAALAVVGADEAPGRTIVVGFDGMDPGLTEAWMAEGSLPNFAKLRQQGHYQPLPTTNPAQSPVAWSSFATGLNPGAHGIFDFLSRNPQTYGPDYSIASVTPARQLQLFGLQLPLDSGSIANRRVGTPFWVSAEREGQPASVLRVPVTYPPDPITRMLSGMGVPDLLGTQGTFTVYTTGEVAPETTGGRQIQVKPVDGRVEVAFEGPPDPFWVEPTPMSVPVVIEQRDGGKVGVEIDGTAVELQRGAWSDWVTVKFTFGGFMNVRGIVRLYLVDSFPNLKLYVSPIQIDPRAPVVPISSPADYSADLASRIGLFHTIGMPEETWALNEGQMTDDGWLDMEATILHEREAMFFDTLAQNDSRLIVQVFVQTDRTSHMFWRGIDDQHPLHAETSERGKGAIRWIYGEADRILGKTMAAMGPKDRLIVLSDHGFAPWRYGVNLNRWLVDNGFMATKPGQPTSEQLFANVNWTKTQAYAIGLNDIYLNRRGREALGIVRDDQLAAVKQEIIAKLQNAVDPETGEPFMLTVYDAAEIYDGKMMGDAPDLVVGYAPGYRASWQTALGGVPEKLVVPNDRKWSGDHCIEPSKVPGILFTSFAVQEPVGSIAELPKLIKVAMQRVGAGEPGGDRTEPRLARHRLARAVGDRQHGAGLAAGVGASDPVGGVRVLSLDGHLSADLAPAGAVRRQGQGGGDPRGAAGLRGRVRRAVAHPQAQSRPRRQAARAHLHPRDDRLVPGPVHPGLDVQCVRRSGPGGRVDRAGDPGHRRRPDPAAGDLAGGWQGRGGGGGHLGRHLAGRRHLAAARGFRRQYTLDPAHGRTGAHGASA